MDKTVDIMFGGNGNIDGKRCGQNKDNNEAQLSPQVVPLFTTRFIHRISDQ